MTIVLLALAQAFVDPLHPNPMQNLSRCMNLGAFSTPFDRRQYSPVRRWQLCLRSLSSLGRAEEGHHTRQLLPVSLRLASERLPTGAALPKREQDRFRQVSEYGQPWPRESRPRLQETRLLHDQSADQAASIWTASFAGLATVILISAVTALWRRCRHWEPQLGLGQQEPAGLEHFHDEGAWELLQRGG